MDQMNRANQALIDKAHRQRASKAVIFDLDSTHADTFGAQESTAYNAHYGTVGYHPLVAFDGVTGDFLKAALRPGNVYTSNGVVDFIRPSAAPADTSETECHYTETEYRAKSWDRSRKVIVQSVRPAGELFFTHSFYVTNLIDAFTPEAIVRTYQKRGTMENYIKEVKNGFGFNQMNSHSFQVNQVRMMLSLLAYNLTNWLRTLCFPDGQKTMQIDTIRTRIIKVASRVVKSGRRLYFKLASSFVYQSFFWKVLRRVQQLPLE